MHNSLKYWLLMLTSSILVGLLPSYSSAFDGQGLTKWGDQLYFEWGGHLRGTTQVSFWDANTLQAGFGPRTAVNSGAELRLMNRTFAGQDTYVQTHYLARFEYRDSLQTRRRVQDFAAGFEFLDILRLPENSDQSQLFDFSHILHQEGRTRIWHGLDRLNLTMNRSWGTLRLGRQAVSWGNGLIFHPLDLFNPFPPTEVLSDYKAGQDMVSATIPFRTFDELQLLVIPRRKANGSVHWDRSSLAGKVHLLTDRLQMDIMAAHHFDASVLGLGLSGNIGSSAWRTDLTWTGIKSGPQYFSAVANVDRSWVWRQKNWYGLLELYYHGLGEAEPEKALLNADLIRRLHRGEIFVLSRVYMASVLEVEVSPLFRLNMTVICNMGDGSGLVQPTLRWDLATDLEFIAGATVYAGGRDTEFGGLDVETSAGSLTIAPANSVFAWLTAYF
jgi:hypothetical protein